MDIGYARVSTAKQDLDRQIDALRAEGIPEKRIYVDKKSGFNTNRPGLQAALDYVGDGDVIVVHTLDRLGRAVRDTLNMIHDLSDRGSRSALSRGSYPGRLSKAGQPDVATCPGDAGSVRADGKNVRRRTRRTCTGRGRQQRQANRQALGRDQTKLAYAAHLREAGLSIPQIVEKTGITRSSLYRHLPPRPLESLMADGLPAPRAADPSHTARWAVDARLLHLGL